jgi:tetratricopeptide (TPR) repeat protein
MWMCLATSWAQPAPSRAARQSQEIFDRGCRGDEDHPLNVANCSKAFNYIQQALRTEPSSPQLNFLYASAELLLEAWKKVTHDPPVPDRQADAVKRLRDIIRAQPVWAEPYFELLQSGTLSGAEGNSLLRQLLTANPKVTQAYLELIGRLSAEAADAGINAAEIVRLCVQYRKLVSFDESFDTEIERFAIDGLLEAGRTKEAAQILEPIIEYSLNSDNPVSACAELLNERPSDFRSVPDVHSKLQRLRSFCTGREHEAEAFKLMSAGKLSEAAQELELQITANPGYPWAFPQLAEMYVKLGRKEDAVRILHRFLSGGWTRQARCETLNRFGDLARYRVAGDPAVDQFQTDCRGVK